MLGGTGTPGALPVIALAERGYKGPLYGNHGMISADFLRLAGKSAEGIICPTGPVTPPSSFPKAIRSARSRWRSARPTRKPMARRRPMRFRPDAFDGWLVFMDAARRAKATGAAPGTPAFRNALREALFTTKEVVGTHGIYTYTPADRHGVDSRARIMVQIENGNTSCCRRQQARSSGVAQLRLERAHVDRAIGADCFSRERLDLSSRELAR